MDIAAFIQLHQAGERQALLPFIEAADAVGKLGGQHGDDFIRVIDGSCALISFLIQRGVRADIVADIRNMNAQLIAAVLGLHQADGVVDILGLGRVDGKDRQTAQVGAVGSFGGMNATEVEDAVRDYLMDTIRRQDLLIQIGEVMVYGSRCRGTEKTTSDIDIVVEYKGDIREDDLFNLFHEDEFLLGNHKVDINPIQADKSGNIAEFLQQVTIYMESEMVFSIGNRYIYIQNATEGYDYTIYGLDMKEIDGGVYDDSDISIYEALDEIVADLREYPDGNIVKGSVRKDSPLVPVNLEEFEEAVERSRFVPPKITYTVAECGEFHSMGRYQDDIENVNEAIALWNEYKKGTLNGVPSIGILVHTPGQTELEDVQVDLVSGKTMDLDMIRYYPEINTEETAIQKICELVENLYDVEVIGKVPENVSAELILREFDPKQEIYNEEERSLIKEYAAQVKDMPKAKGLARCICYQEKFGNQDVALAMITVREKIAQSYGGKRY